MTELRDPYLRRPIPAATRPRRVALARPISRAGVRPRPQGRERLERPGPGTPTWVPACSYPESQSRRERREEERQEENKSCKQAGRREATDGRTSGQASDDYRLRTIPIGRAPPISHAAFQFQTLSSSRAAAHITSRHLLVYLSLASRLSGLCFLRKFGFFLADCLSLQCRPSTLVLVPHDPIARLRPPCRHSCCWGQPLGRSTPTVDPFYLDPTGVPTRKKLLAVPIPRSLQAPSSKLDASGHIKSVVVSTRRRRRCCCCKIAVVLLDLHSKVKA